MKDYSFKADNLYGFFSELRPKERVSMLRSAIRRSAKKLKKEAENQLFLAVKSSKPETLRKGVWVDVYTRTAGFRVSVAGKKGLTPRRDGRMVPLMVWLEDGTTPERKTRSYKGRAGSLNRGGLSAKLFLAKAAQATEQGISADIQNEFLTVLANKAKKYGCEV